MRLVKCDWCGKEEMAYKAEIKIIAIQKPMSSELDNFELCPTCYDMIFAHLRQNIVDYSKNK